MLLTLDPLPNPLLLVHADRVMATELCQRILGKEHEKKIASGNHPDIHYYVPDEKSRLHLMGDIQKLIQETNFPPYEAKYKVFVIEEAEKMLASSANALLKTLEESGQDTFFIFITSYPKALLSTIRSRLFSIMMPPKSKERVELSQYFAFVKEQRWDSLLDTIEELEKEDPEAIFSSFLAGAEHPLHLQKMVEWVAEAQTALTYHCKLRTVLLDLFLKTSSLF